MTQPPSDQMQIKPSGQKMQVLAVLSGKLPEGQATQFFPFQIGALAGHFWQPPFTAKGVMSGHEQLLILALYSKGILHEVHVLEAQFQRVGGEQLMQLPVISRWGLSFGQLHLSSLESYTNPWRHISHWSVILSYWWLSGQGMHTLVVGFQQLGEGQATQLEFWARNGLVSGHTQEELVASNILPVGQTMHFLLKESQLASTAQLTHVLLKARLGSDFGHKHLLRSVLYQRLLGQDTHFCVLQFQKLGALQDTQCPSPVR